MARPALPPSPSTIAATNLARLLSRLEQRINTLEREGDSAPFEREKLLANLEYARRLHAQLKKGSSIDGTSNSSSPAGSMVIGTAARVFGGDVKRELRLKEDLQRWDGCLRELSKKAAELKAAEEKVEEIPEPEPEPEPEVFNEKVEEPQETHSGYVEQQAMHTQAPNELRNRFKKSEAKPESTDVLLQQQEREQENLTADLLKMAKMLKESSMQFGTQLEEEKPYLEMAAKGLDKNMEGMDVTGARMDNLRRNESVGWYRTIINTAIVIVLVILIMIVLSLPKLRR